MLNFNFKIKAYYLFIRQLMSFICKKPANTELQLAAQIALYNTAYYIPFDLLPKTILKFKTNLKIKLNFLTTFVQSSLNHN